MSTKDASIHIRLPSELRARYEAVAEEQDRKVSSLMVIALTGWMNIYEADAAKFKKPARAKR